MQLAHKGKGKSKSQTRMDKTMWKLSQNYEVSWRELMLRNAFASVQNGDTMHHCKSPGLHTYLCGNLISSLLTFGIPNTQIWKHFKLIKKLFKLKHIQGSIKKVTC